MSHRRSFHICVFILAIFVIGAFSACKSSASPAPVENPIAAAPPQPSPAVEATPAQKLPPPTRDEVKAAFTRVFGDDLVARFDPDNFIVGDFNGDQSEDIAIIARPAPGNIAQVNDELSDWIIQDADKAFIPPAGKRVVLPPAQQRPQIRRDEEVLAIIHGFGPRGWRNQEARQAYLVKNAAAQFVGTAPSLSQKAIRAMRLPVETEIIRELRNNRKGFVFWTGGNYAWHPSES